MQAKLRNKIISVAFYLISIVLVKYILVNVPWLDVISDSIIALLVFLAFGEIISLIKMEFKYLAISLAVFFFLYYFPYDFSRIDVGIIGAGLTLFLSSYKFGEPLIQVVQGVGIIMVFLALSNLVYPLSPIFKYLAIFSGLGYGFASLEGFRILHGRYFTENLKGMIIIGGLLGIIKVNPFKGYLGFAINSISLLLILGITGLIVTSIPSKKAKEEVIVGRLKHEVRLNVSVDEIYREAKLALDDFILHGKKEKIVAFLTYYGIKSGLSLNKIEEIIAPIVNYEGRKYSVLSPSWFIRLMEKKEIERRKKIVEEVFRRMNG
ncbi:hypothetical protein [Pyrococcus horikoshii]|uniref:Uncharacterized protein n=2 Tax=Pyrococcus horikoshii TaxID=53953 RepID=O58066_PYRHO|nr:hypothetical protein [Pyrococcus horikoshii]BAA29402.1 320aa long hypothetical protein [Pyrococcus horikoshii OT3]HII61093.1 hypothetical protein [Pyrococcus horikoshii]